jgi:hypothetical protein
MKLNTFLNIGAPAPIKGKTGLWGQLWGIDDMEQLLVLQARIGSELSNRYREKLKPYLDHDIRLKRTYPVDQPGTVIVQFLIGKKIKAYLVFDDNFNLVDTYNI